MDKDERECSELEMIQRLYEGAGEDVSPLPQDRTGGLRFRRSVPEALLHLSRDNRSEVTRLIREAKSAQRRALDNFREGGITEKMAVLYWHCTDFELWDIADAFELGVEGVRLIAEENPIVTFGCLDCDEVLRPQSRKHFREMLSALRMLDENPELHGQYLYTGLHCENCTKEREERWGMEWARQEREYQERIRELRAMPYGKYLSTAHWKLRRKQKLESVDDKCQACSVHQPLEVHHRDYRRLGEELDGDLLVLCRGCHAAFHKHRR